MDWNAKLLLRFAALFVLLSVGVTVAILRLGGVIHWPSRPVAIGALLVTLAPVAYVLAASLGDRDRRAETSSWDWFFPW